MDLQEEFNKIDLQKSFLVGVVILGLYWMLFYDDGASYDALITQARQAEAKSLSSLQKVRKALDDQKKFEDEIKNITLNMKDFQKYFADTMDVNTLLSKVSTYAEEHNIVVNNLKPVQKTSEFPNYPEVAVEFKVEGSFHNVMEFIADLTRMKKAIDFSKMEFKTTVKGDYPLVQLTTTLVVYNASEAGGGNG